MRGSNPYSLQKYGILEVMIVRNEVTDMESKETFSFLERELAMFVRRAEATRIANLKYNEMERSTYLLLLHLEENGPMGIKALSEAFQLDLSTLSRQTAALESKKYVERKSDPADARINLLSITKEGQTQLTEVREQRREFYTHLLKEWELDDCETFAVLLEKFNQTVVKYKRSK